MRESPWSGNESLPLSLAQQVDAACNRFEQAWMEGHRPVIEDFLAGTPEADQAVLLRELVPLDADYRRRLGEEPQPHDYHPRFPALDLEWLTRALTPPVTQEPKPAPAKAKPAATKTQRIRCPHCHNPIQLADDHLDEVLCPGCGSSFRVRDARQTTTTSTMRPLGKFQLLERVGLGAFGAVWRARDHDQHHAPPGQVPAVGAGGPGRLRGRVAGAGY